MHPEGSKLAGKRILVAEDEPMIAMLIEDILFDLGYEIVGPASNLAQALRLAEDEDFDAAILDVRLGPDTSFQVADLLVRAEVPFAFATGYAEGSLNYDAPVLQKPYSFDSVSAMLRRLAPERSAGN